jgi:superfamily II DNA or RNA helicase
MAYAMPHTTPVPCCMVADRRVVEEIARRDGVDMRSAATRAALLVLHGELRAGEPALWVRDAQGRERWLELEHAVCAIGKHAAVQHVAMRSVSGGLGEGRVMDWRTLGGREQLLVEFSASLERRWLPYQHLSLIHDLRADVRDGRLAGEDHAERLRLRALARGLELWHRNTGALDELDIDPLPHQIHLVHHLIRSNHLNWIIADDVGLGKTIEVGMILHQRFARSPNARVLIVTPPGLVTQWKEELELRFGLDDFEVYGEDFAAKKGKELLRRKGRVIASMDRLKQPGHREALEQAGQWDLIIVDEAHRLTRKQYGLKYDASDRFKLASEVLRQRTNDLLLLTATPHQGRTDQFQGLVELVRPELREATLNVSCDPGFLRDVLYRNRKVDVTDAEGRFIFHGQDAHAVEIQTGEAELAFDAALQRYFEEALGALEGKQRIAVGFVVTVMRKLASSSHAAILRALINRRERITLKAAVAQRDREELDGEELEEELGEATPFFAGELARLGALIAQAEALHAADAKLEAFLTRIVDQLDPAQRLLVFTEFRGTQELLVGALRARLGHEAVCQINGQMKLDERREAQAAFRGSARFLVSTEAGGEGLNLHHDCYTMVNYDLPWNPMRMVQRVGRLYRYGQARRVQVFNLYSRATVDERVVGLMYQRLETVAREMSAVGEEFASMDRLRVEIFGELADLMDVGDLLEQGPLRREDRSEERVEEALRRAQQARALQHELMEGARGYDPGAMADQLQLGMEHVMSFVCGMVERLGGRVERELYQGRVVELRLPEELAHKVLGARRQLVRLTTDRTMQRDAETQLLTIRTPLLRELLDRAAAHEFGGHSASVYGLDGALLACAQLRWMGDRGQLSAGEIEREELLVVRTHEDGAMTLNDPEVTRWLLTPAVSATRMSGTPGQRMTDWAAIDQRCDAHLAAIAHDRLYPAQRHILAAATLRRT